MNYYLLFKSLHLIAVISWMAGLLDLPRIFDYNSENMNSGFNYLIQIPLYHLSEEKIVELESIIKDLQNRYDELNLKTIEEIWLDELKLLKKEL